MIAKYRDEYINTKKGKSRFYFKKGFCSVFAEEVENIKEEKIRSTLETLLDTLYDGARCGMYHIGFTDTRIFLADGETPPIKFDSFGRVTLNPHKLVKLIIIHFNSYIKLLKDCSNTSLRNKFEQRFDFDTRNISKKWVIFFSVALGVAFAPTLSATHTKKRAIFWDSSKIIKALLGTLFFWERKCRKKKNR
jgi:hypothetical protein